jgi:DNA uptake protein ComE-like DNA-binding protein
MTPAAAGSTSWTALLVDKYLAEQIYAGVRAGTITRLDDLSKINGIDQSRFSVIRPRVRWE